MKYYKCGHVMTTHGIKGELKVKNLSDFERFKKNSKVYVYHNDEYILEEILNVRNSDDILYITFKGKEDINLVEKYRNDDIYISELDRNSNDLSDNEYYYSDLIGKKVFNQNNESRGEVIDIRNYPSSYYLCVKYNDKNVLIPFKDMFIKEVKDVIIINEIEGLF